MARLEHRARSSSESRPSVRPSVRPSTRPFSSSRNCARHATRLLRTRGSRLCERVREVTTLVHGDRSLTFFRRQSPSSGGDESREIARGGVRALPVCPCVRACVRVCASERVCYVCARREVCARGGQRERGSLVFPSNRRSLRTDIPVPSLLLLVPVLPVSFFSPLSLVLRRRTLRTRVSPGDRSESRCPSARA